MTDKKPRASDREDAGSPLDTAEEPVERDNPTIFDPSAGPESHASTSRPGGGRVRLGQTLAERFEVTRFLGSGGMGEVFAARDLKLGEVVALKVVRSGLGNADRERRRLRREVQLARRVTHRNICRIYDLFEHRNPRTGATLDLVSMELLEGETLHRYQRRQGGRLSAAQALPIVRQIARGLHAAHQHGIVHRDLKPGNVMLEREAEAGLRATITDFGLAKRVGLEGAPDPALTGEGKMIGSPGYMAPEQVAAKPTSPATDLFSLGLLLYEMLSGRLPYTGSSPWEIAVNRLLEPPTPLSSLLPELDPTIVGVVDRCLQREPQDRFQSASEFLDRLDRGDSAWNIYGHKSSDELPRPHESQTLPDAAATPTPSWSTESSISRRDETSSASVSHAPASNAPPHQPESEPSPPPRGLLAAPWSRRLGAGLVGLGGLAAVSMPWWSSPDRVAPTPRGAGELALEATPAAESITLPATPNRPTASALATSNPPSGLSPGQAVQRLDALERAHAHLRVYDAEPARELLEASLAALPADPILDVHLAEALWRLGHEDRLRTVIERAQANAAGLAEPERLLIKGLHQGFLGDWESAAETLKYLWSTGPSLEVGLWIAEATISSGRFEPLAEIFTGLRALPGHDGQDPRIDLWQGRINYNLDDDEAAEPLARQAFDIATERGHRYLLFESLQDLHLILFSLDRDVESREALISADRLARELDQPFVLARVMYLKGRNFNITGYRREALLELEAADALFARQGSSRGICQTSSQHAMIPSQEGLLERLGRGLEACSQSGFGLREAWVTHHLARAARDTGDFENALKSFRRSAQLMEQLGHENGLAHSRVSLSLLLAQMGRVDEALANLAIADEWFRETPEATGFSVHLNVSSLIAIRAGRLREAGAWLEEVAAFEPTGGRLLDFYRIQCDLAYTQNDLEALHLAAASLKQHARLLANTEMTNVALGYEALTMALGDDLVLGLEEMASVDPASLIGGQIALVYLQAGRREQAAAATRAYTTWAEGTYNQEDTWLAEILRIQLDRETPRATAIARLRQIEEEAGENGDHRIELQAALARGQLEGDPAALADVRDRANRWGFQRLAEQAKGARSD
ncbi:MAG: protein kinase [Acidobacteriota bacterium]